MKELMNYYMSNARTSEQRKQAQRLRQYPQVHAQLMNSCYAPTYVPQPNPYAMHMPSNIAYINGPSFQPHMSSMLAPMGSSQPVVVRGVGPVLIPQTTGPAPYLPSYQDPRMLILGAAQIGESAQEETRPRPKKKRKRRKK